MGVSRQEYRSGWPCPPPGDLPDPGVELGSPALQAASLPSEPLWKPTQGGVCSPSARGLMSGGERPGAQQEGNRGSSLASWKTPASQTAGAVPVGNLDLLGCPPLAGLSVLGWGTPRPGWVVTAFHTRSLFRGILSLPEEREPSLTFLGWHRRISVTSLNRCTFPHVFYSKYVLRVFPSKP